MARAAWIALAQYLRLQDFGAMKINFKESLDLKFKIQNFEISINKNKNFKIMETIKMTYIAKEIRKANAIQKEKREKKIFKIVLFCVYFVLLSILGGMFYLAFNVLDIPKINLYNF